MNIDKLIYDQAINAGFSKKLAMLIIGQARLESADYTNNQFKTNNNIFGFKYVNQPLAIPGNKSPEGNFYAKYKSPNDSVKDYIERYFSFSRGGVSTQDLKNSTDSTDFANKLKQRGFFGITAKQYAAGIEAKLKSIDLTKLAVGGGIFIILAIVLYIVIKKK